ncbi:MAG: G8 domain-containing protein [Bacteroidota bacterium]
MKKILLATLTLFLIHCVSAQTNTFTATASGWNTAGNWSLGIIPTSSHDVIIPSGKTVTGMSSAGANNCKTLTVSGTLTFSGGNPRYITVSDTVLITSGGVINMTGSNAYYIVSIRSRFLPALFRLGIFKV